MTEVLHHEEETGQTKWRSLKDVGLDPTVKGRFEFKTKLGYST